VVFSDALTLEQVEIDCKGRPGACEALSPRGKDLVGNPLRVASTDGWAAFADSREVLADFGVRVGEGGPKLAMVTQETIWRRP
jgi:hypothetical protein